MYNNMLQAYRAAAPEYVAKQIEGVKSSHDDRERAEIRARVDEDIAAMAESVAEIVKMIQHDIVVYSQGGGFLYEVPAVPAPVLNLIRVMRNEEARACRLIEGQVSDNNITVEDAINLLEKVGRIVFEAERRITASVDSARRQTVSF